MATTHIVAPANTTASRATSQWLSLPLRVFLFRHVNSRHGHWIKNPRARSTSKLTSSSCHFGRCSNSDLPLKLGLSYRSVQRQCRTALQSSVALTSSFWTGRDEEGEVPSTLGLIKLRKRRCSRPKAYQDFPYRIPYPEVTKKPEWWWRTLACIPYLMALQLSDVAFYLQPLIERHEQFEFLSYYVPGAIRRLPSWFLMVYCFAVYVGVVRNRQWPHFFRYHVMMGLLMENVVQIVWHASNFMPLINYWGTFGMHYWTMVGLVYIAFLLECVRCALAGMYVHIPFISDAAYLHTPYAKGDS